MGISRRSRRYSGFLGNSVYLYNNGPRGKKTKPGEVKTVLAYGTQAVHVQIDQMDDHMDDHIWFISVEDFKLPLEYPEIEKEAVEAYEHLFDCKSTEGIQRSMCQDKPDFIQIAVGVVIVIRFKPAEKPGEYYVYYAMGKKFENCENYPLDIDGVRYSLIDATIDLKNKQLSLDKI